jgi:eukaryotic-like serine/threonine-protein kinase
MAAVPHDCPPTELLEDLALGRSVGGALHEHLTACPACAAALAKIRDDNRFLREFAVAGSLPRASDGNGGTIVIPGYEIVREVHVGGQGVVYEATQQSTRRRVAVKVTRRGRFATHADRVRFDREVETLGRLKHPNIVAVHDAGTIGGIQYCVMDFIDGLPLDRYVAQRWKARPDVSEDESSELALHEPQAVRGALDLFVRVCDAVHAAHLRGVIHRDLKPSNILVDAAGEPRVLDFGLAKAADSRVEASMTKTGQFVGSLPWASPEQASGSSDRIDLRTDVYSLGVILYQILTGRFPYEVEGPLREVLDRILTVEPSRPSARRESRTGASLRFDDELDTIVLRCLAKDRERRYQSAGELARDVRRYLAGEPIEAKRDSAMYLLRKTLHRYRRRVIAAGLMSLLLAAAAIGMAWMYREADLARAAADRSARSLAAALSETRIEQGRLAGASGNLELAERLLWSELLFEQRDPTAPRPRLAAAPGNPAAYWALWSVYRREPVLRTLHFGGRAAVTIPHPDGRLFGIDVQRSLGWWVSPDTAAWTSVEFPKAHGEFARINSADGGQRLFVSTSEEALYIALPEVRLRGRWPTQEGVFACSRDGRRVLTYRDGEFSLWPADEARGPKRVAAGASFGERVAVSNDGRWIAVLGHRGRLDLLDVETGATRLIGHPQRRDSVQIWAGACAFSPDSTRLAESRLFEPIRVWDVTKDPPETLVTVDVPEAANQIVFRDDGGQIAAGCTDAYVRLINVPGGTRSQDLFGHSLGVQTIAYAADGKSLWTCGTDAVARQWDIAAQREAAVTAIEDERLHLATLSPDGRFCAATGWIGTTYLWERGDVPRVWARSTTTVPALRFSRDGKRLLTGSNDGVLTLRDIAGGAELTARLSQRISYAEFSRDGQRVLVSSDDGTVHVLSAADLTPIRAYAGHPSRVPCFAVSRDERTLVAACYRGVCRVWSMAEGTFFDLQHETTGAVRTVAFLPDGRHVITGGADRLLRVWDLQTRGVVRTLAGHKQEIFASALDPAGRRLASGDRAGLVQVWDVETGEALLSLDGHRSDVLSLEFDRTGNELVSASSDGTVRFWNLDYFRRHIKGNVASQLRLRGGDDAAADRAAGWDAWAASADDATD